MGGVCLRNFLSLGLVLLVGAATAEAQYFGRNKVEYVDFDFRVLHTQHFDVYHYGREERAAHIAAQLAERWYSRFSRLLTHEFSNRQALVLYASQPEFAQTNVVSGLLSDTVGGVTESAKRRIVMPFAPTLGETNRVLGHEIAHAFQFDIAKRRGGGMNQPLWFIEGMAEYLARGGSDDEARLWLRDAVLSERLPQRERDAARKLSPYQYGHAFWSYLAERFGDEVIDKALKPGKKQARLNDRMQYATGIDLEKLFTDWRAAVSATRPVELAAVNSSDGFRFLHNTSGRVHLGPALSPDGRYAVFFSERDRLSLDLFLADAKMGTIIRKIATTTASARFESLQPLRSAGAWSPNGDHFVFPAVRQGHATLVFVDMRLSQEAETARRESRDEIEFHQLGQILTTTWSPDGRALAFSALADGFTNLYLYDLDSATLRQLTDDAYADLHPAWSPDGREIAFATDRYSTNLTSLQFGGTELAVINPESGAVRRIETQMEASAQTSPQWSMGGRHLYFVADSDGVRNVFGLDLVSDTLSQVTHVRTGITGLTPTSPSLSVAAKASTLAFTIYRNGRHELVTLDGLAAVSGRPVSTPVALAANSPPTTEKGVLQQLLDDSRTGLPDSSSMEVRPYSSQLSLERVGQPYLSTGGGAFGTFVRAGGSFLFGDMLSERRLGMALQIGNHLRDVALETRFLNQEHRWNWGAIADLEPSLRRYRFNHTIDHDGQPALMKQADYLQRMQLHAAGLLAYPFSRGLRLEFTAGVRHARYHRDVRSRVSSLATGLILLEDRVESSGGDPTTVGEIGTALVGDTTVFGPTGPLLGSRFRFEISPAAGNLVYANVLADYRRYLMPVRPYTLAMRLLHTGRYGRDGDDPRLLPSFLGSRYYVRGHGWDARNCSPDPELGCGNELLGSRLLVANLELRVPLWGVPSRQLEYGPLPIDAFVFADGGIVWRKGRIGSTDPLRFVQRGVISSIGAGVRVNAGGLPFEVGAVRALDGPTPGWTADFGFRTGF